MKRRVIGVRKMLFDPCGVICISSSTAHCIVLLDGSSNPLTFHTDILEFLHLSNAPLHMRLYSKQENLRDMRHCQFGGLWDET
jgi:hypothetical protein